MESSSVSRRSNIAPGADTSGFRVSVITREQNWLISKKYLPGNNPPEGHATLRGMWKGGDLRASRGGGGGGGGDKTGESRAGGWHLLFKNAHTLYNAS